MRLGVALLTVLAACRAPLPFEPAGPAHAPPPSEYGPYPVGVRTLELDDRTRPDEATGAPRHLVVEVWYPADDSARGKPGVVYPIRDALPKKVLDKIGDKNPGDLVTIAVRDAAPQADDGPYPLIVFSHGAGGVRQQSTHLTVALASHGYVVAAPDHTGNTLKDVLSADDLNFGTQLTSYVDRPLDLSFVIRALEKLPASDPLHGLSDPARIGAIGHSFGAVAAIRAAGLDPKIRAAIPQAPAGYTAAWISVEKPMEELGIPVMVMAGGLDDTVPEDPHARSYWPHLRSPRFFLDLKTGGHFTFSDLCQLDRETLLAADDFGVGRALEDGCGPMNIAADKAQALIRHHAIGMMNAYLRASPGTLALLTQGEAARLGGAEVALMAEP